MTYVIRPAAERDLEAIWSYTATRWGPSQATAYTEEIRRRIERAARSPMLGSPVAAKSNDYRKTRAGSHLIIYRSHEEMITVVRVLHEREDISAFLETSES